MDKQYVSEKERMKLGKQIYLTDKEIKWLQEKLEHLSGMGKYFDGGEEKEILDRVGEKLSND